MKISSRPLVALVCLAAFAEGSAAMALKLAFEAPMNERLFVNKKAANPAPAPITLPDDGKKPKLPISTSPEQKLLPLPLLKTAAETRAEEETLTSAEREELMDLWQATVNRSPDIQFVISRLQQTTDQKHQASLLMKTLSGAIFTGMQVVPFSPGLNTPARMGLTSAVDIFRGLLNGGREKGVTQSQLSQEQATILYTIVRNTADKLVDQYRLYRRDRGNYQRAVSDLEDLRDMANAVRAESDIQQFMILYSLRKAQRDAASELAEMKLRRQHLVDLAGSEAVEKLDTQLAQEQSAIERLIADDRHAPAADEPQPRFRAPKLRKPNILGGTCRKSTEPRQ
jgi:hypothetical protein